MITKGLVMLASAFFFFDMKYVEKRAFKKAANIKTQPFTTKGGAKMLKPPTMIPAISDELERVYAIRRNLILIGCFMLFVAGLIYDNAMGITIDSDELTRRITYYCIVAGIIVAGLKRVYLIF